MSEKNLEAIKLNFAGKFDDTKEIEIHKYVFQVQNAESIEVNLLEGIFEHAPIIVKDPVGKVRVLFNFKARLRQRFVSRDEEHTTNGAVAGPLQNGDWTIIVVKPSLRVKGKYQLEVRTDRVITQIDEDDYFSPVDCLNEYRLDKPENSWLKAELHAHSYYSDGRVSLEEIKESIENRLDVYSLTDHSLVTTKFPKGKYLVIPGCELTFDNEYHYNVYGLTDLIDYSKFFEGEAHIDSALDKCFSELSKNNLLSINHIFAEDLSRKHNFDIRYFSFLEVINAPYSVTDVIDNDKAVRLFDFLWKKGYNLFGLGGSDAHKNNYDGRYPAGMPLTKVFVRQPSAKGVLDAMQLGNLYMADRVNVEAGYRYKDEELLPGSECPDEFKAFGNSDELLEWRLIQDGECIKRELTTHFEAFCQLNKGSYLRLEARMDGEIKVFVNPIVNHHIDNKQPALMLDLLKEFDSVEESAAL